MFVLREIKVKLAYFIHLFVPIFYPLDIMTGLDCSYQHLDW